MQTMQTTEMIPIIIIITTAITMTVKYWSVLTDEMIAENNTQRSELMKRYKKMNKIFFSGNFSFCQRINS